MNEYSTENANNLFKKLVSFLEYNHLTYYEKACFEDNAEYVFFSKSRTNIGFFIELRFS